MKKILARLLIISLFVSGTFFLKPPEKTQALFGVGDVVYDPGNFIPNLLGYGEEIYSNVIVSVLEVAVKKLADKVLDKLVDDTLNWAAGNNKEEPGIRDNWEGFLAGTKYEVISSSFVSATQVANGILPENTGGDPGTQAQQNYNIWASGELDSSRAVADTIARFGAKQLNYDPLNSIINGEGETLSKLLGSQEQKDSFSSDFNAGGIMGYIALADPHNSSLGKQGLVESALSNKTEEKVKNSVEETQATTSFLNKTECVEYGEDGNCTREITETPGDLVGSLVGKSLGSEQDKAINTNGLVDSLVKAIGNLTDGLLEQGFNKLTDAAFGTFFDQNQSTNEFGGDYQSDYDVLGISSDVDITGGGSGSTGNGGVGGPDNSNIFIGGPEHTTGEYGTQPQIIVNFEEDLEKNLNFLIDEKKYFDDVRRLLVNSSNILYEFDKCIPGADYGWEQRYKDNLNFFTTEGDEGVQNKIGFNEQKTMLQDPKVTIPGGTTLLARHQSILNSAESGSAKNKLRLDQINASIATLEYIKQSVLEEFNQQKQAYNENLVLFKSDWEKLSESQKAEALQQAEQQGYFINNTSSTVDANSGTGSTGLMTSAQALAVIQTNEAKALAAVLTTSWNIWRNQTDAETKLDLRKAYYVTIPKLSSEEFVATAKIQADQLQQIILNGYGLALDCMVFKMYALGISRDYIAGIVFDNELSLEDKVLQSAAVINQYDPIDVGTTTNAQGEAIAIGGAIAGGPILGTIGGWLGGGRNQLVSEYFNVSRARSNEAILAFLESEYNLKQQNLPSVFTTTNMINPEAINNSLLGFETIEARNEYFDLYYPDLSGRTAAEVSNGSGGGGILGNIFGHEASNVFTIKEMYRKDRVYADSNRLQGGMRGFLFCRTPGEFTIVNNDGDKNDKSGSRCWTAYYSASRLDYQLFISGINN